MPKYLYLTLILFTTCGNIVAQDTLAKKILGIWQYIAKNDDGGYLIFINNHSGAFTSNTRFLQYYFDYQLAAGGQPTLITEHYPIYNDRQYSSVGLVSLKNDSTLIINRETKGKKALSMEGKKVFIYRKLANENIETFIRKPNQNDLIGTWLSVFKKDTTMSFTFKSNNTVDIKVAKINKTANTIYKVDFSKQPMTLDLISPKGEILPNIFVFQGDSTLRIAGPKKGLRRTQFSIFGDNFFLEKKGTNMKSSKPTSPFPIFNRQLSNHFFNFPTFIFLLNVVDV